MGQLLLHHPCLTGRDLGHCMAFHHLMQTLNLIFPLPSLPHLLQQRWCPGDMWIRRMHCLGMASMPSSRQAMSPLQSSKSPSARNYAPRILPTDNHLDQAHRMYRNRGKCSSRLQMMGTCTKTTCAATSIHLSNSLGRTGSQVQPRM